MNDQLVRMSPKSRVIREEWFVDDTYLVGDDGHPLLFVHQFVEYETPSGRVKRRQGHDIWEFENEDAMASKVKAMDASEGHPGDVPCIRWVPDGWEGTTT